MYLALELAMHKLRTCNIVNVMHSTELSCPEEFIENKSSMEHIPRAQPRSCMLLEGCLYVLPMNMLVLPVYLHAHWGNIRSLFSILQEEKGN